MKEDNQDLPLHSLGSDYKVEHYMLKLTCLLEQRIFRGEVFAFIRNTGPGSKLILDLKDLQIDQILEIDASKEEIQGFLKSYEEKKSHATFECWTSKKAKRRLDYSAESWCVKVETLKNAEAVVCFQYHTNPDGSSVSWVLDDDNIPCCLTTGSLVNNRTLLPSQDAPTLMATWQLLLQVPNGFNSVTTGDNEGIVTESGTYFYTSMLLPISTFAVAIGKWQCIQLPFHSDSTPRTDGRIVECRHPFYPCPFAKADTAGPIIPCRVFHSASMDPSLLKDYIPVSIETICQILGRHVVPKLDFVIVPQTVACLGFASPGLILISPSILFGRTSMLPRLGHEISHAWFGINIGPKNWNEEWISEGFATFMEDVIELKMSKFTHRSELMALKALNRYQILKSDCHNVDSSLQCMSAKEQSPEVNNVVINGLNRDKMVSQIPYLKGYFFLIRVASIVGLDPLLAVLKNYVEHFHGCLVTTAECVDFFSHQFQEKEQILHQAQIWLHGSSLPDLNNLFILNRLDVEVTQHVQYWKRPTQSTPVFTFSQAMPDQVLALLDRILELEIKMYPKAVRKLIDHYQPHLINADVYHRACELIISQQCTTLLPMVREFLLQHPAMGAYLYGELMLCDRPQFQAVAMEVFSVMESKLDANFLTIIRDLMVRAWYMEDSEEDQRLEHQKNPPQPVDIKELAAITGVLHWKLNVETYEVDGEIDRIKKERGYVYEDVIEISPEKLPNYEEKLKIFYAEHLHTDEEIRFCMAGSGYFDVRDARNDTWIRISVDAGDLIVLPAGIYHRFTLDSKNYIKAKRYFVGEPVWTPYNRPADEMPARSEYLASIQSSA